jgi:hypothetical protein
MTAGTCLRRVALRVKGVFIGSKMMNRFGWGVVTTLTLGMFMFASTAIMLPWWSLDFSGDCAGYHLVMMLQRGMCDVSQSNQPETNGAKCLGWRQEADWDTVDEESGKDTNYAVFYVYPLILVLSYASISIMLLQLLLCIWQWRVMLKVMWVQRLVLFSTVLFIVIQAWINSIGPETPVTDVKTWQFTNECSNGKSYPGFGDLLPISASYIGCIVLFIVNFPQKCSCVHLIRSDQELSSDVAPPVLNAIGHVSSHGNSLTIGEEIPYSPREGSICSIKYGEARRSDIRTISSDARASSEADRAARTPSDTEMVGGMSLSPP